MKTYARIATWQRLRERATWKLLAGTHAPVVAALLQALLLDGERQLPASLLHERLERELEDLRDRGVDMPQSAKAYVADWLAKGWLERRFPEGANEEQYELTTAAQFAWLVDIDEREWRRLCDMLAWLLAHPDSHLFVRQVPVAGLDSKWLEAHTGRLGEWMRLVTAAQVGNDFWQASGLRREADRWRLRLLDPGLRAVVGGLGDIHAPIDELARLPIAPRRVFIIENKQTGLAFEDVADSVVLMARGYAVDRLHELPWIARAEHVHYWGDIDTHGLAILGRLRSHLPQVASLMMDEATLLTHRDRWVDEPRPHAAEAIDHLDAAEQALYRDLRADRFGVRVRLEQERINWNFAWPRILEAAWQPAKKVSET